MIDVAKSEADDRSIECTRYHCAPCECLAAAWLHHGRGGFAFVRFKQLEFPTTFREDLTLTSPSCYLLGPVLVLLYDPSLTVRRLAVYLSSGHLLRPI